MNPDEFEIFKERPSSPARSTPPVESLPTTNADPEEINRILKQEVARPTILVVDDDLTLQKALQLLLQNRYEVILCSSGQEAVEQINQRVYTVILDIKMQGKDGFQTFVELKAKHPLVPITFHTAYQDIKDPYEVMNDFRPFGYIVKEGNHSLLMDTVNSAVDYYQKIITTMRLVEELRSLNHHLEDRVRDRTATIQAQNTLLSNQKSQLELQISMARNIQRTLLPDALPQVPGARTAFEYRPRMDVGGDFIDYVYKPDSRELGLFLCDVSGNGVPAAFLSSMVKMSLRGWHAILADPAALLYEVHESMQGKLANNFLTGHVSHIDLATGVLTYSSAGHPPPLLLRADGRMEFLPVAGGAIFEFLEMQFTNTRVQLEPGDKLLVYTDGVTEAHDENMKLLDEKGFLDMLAEYPRESPEVICRNLVRDILNFTGNREDNRPDDMAIVVLEYTGD